MLAVWVLSRLVNRCDVWGLYRPWIDSDGVEHETMTAPSRKRRGIDRLDACVLEAHFRDDRFARVGVHSTSATNTSLYGAIDIDRHDGSAATIAGNLELVRRIVAWCRVHHYHALVEDSNGAGGFHIWILFDSPAPTRDVYALLQRILAEIGAVAETYPKQAQLRSGQFGNWLRVFGRHPKRPHYSRILGADGKWLSGEAAVNALLRAPVNGAQLLPAAPGVQQSGIPSCSHPLATRCVDSTDDLSRTITAYLNKLPSLGVGQDRNRVGFRFAAFLTGDCRLSDADALVWLSQWNARNVTPYPDSKVAALLADAHAYGAGGRERRATA